MFLYLTLPRFRVCDVSISDMASSGPPLLLLFFSWCLLCPSTTTAQDPYFQSRCTNDGNFTAGTAYSSNLQRIFSDLTSSTTQFNYGFHNFTSGPVNSIALCRGDINQQSCTTCLNQTISQLRQGCPSQREAVGWSEFCLVRYAARNISRTVDVSPNACLYNTQNASNPDQFNSILDTLLRNLSRGAVSGGSLRKYAADNSTGPGYFQRIYAQVQCTPDLSQQDCGTCLDRAIEGIGSCCSGMIGCRILQPSCILRFESVPFYRDPVPLPQTRSPSPPPSNRSITPTSPGNGSGSSRTVIIVVVCAVVGVLALTLCICFYLRLKRPWKRVETSAVDHDIIKAESLQFDFSSIRAATDNFSESNKLGQGGFGAVYKGRLTNGQDVAVKRLSQSSGQGEVEFKNEVLLVAKLQHRNLVRLFGFSLSGNERLLIYEFVLNASLDQFIFDTVKRTLLDWERRYKIISGIARGLLYLHEDSRLRIIHRDLKASNILLDAEMSPKIADFGMARLFVRDETQGDTSRIVGTYGYMAPEYAMHGHFSVKSDVFSFGVLVLEILSGQKNNCFQNGEDIQDLLSYAWKKWREGNPMNVVDPCLSDGPRGEIMRCMHLGLLCVQENVSDRPNMASIVLMLNSNSITLPVPSQPAFFMHSGRVQSGFSSSQGHNSLMSDSSQSRNESLPLSTNEASITELYPR